MKKLNLVKKPKLFSIIKHRDKELTKDQFIKDIIAGVIVAVIALPLSVALGISSGVTPEKGLITAIVASLFISLFGGSRVQIGGPTGAFVVIVYGIIEKNGIDGLIISTLMAGIILILFGLLHLGNLIKYIPKTVTAGFTAGIAVTLFSTQVKDLFGLNITNVPSEFLSKWKVYIMNLDTINICALILGIISVIIIVGTSKVSKIIPGSLVALITISLAATIFNLPVNTIGKQFGEISSNIPFPTLPKVGMEKITSLIVPSMTIAFLAAIESLLSAVVADGMIEKRHDSNTELVGQGIANIFSAMFGGIPATGAIARTAANVKNGGRTPVAGVVSAIILLIIMEVLMPLIQYVPLTVLGGILAVVSYNMCGFKELKRITFSSKCNMIEMLLTFILTVVFDLVTAIIVSMVVHFIFEKVINRESNEISQIG
ncbi:SulP family inorganic anion transporter [Clostridium sp. Sa3CVN1]|uniref:SulP family inorganic anion transporter n=1 Tax=Clostridium cibarium TaxID=2762247 RepID=A0ABR8PZ59_9CLOT|nr:SulP family inorganic anion transporter [Clostridium cibarium]